ncbi:MULTISPECIES: SDR family NAD(P)-dependent oxidoreductase [unclassified Arthrobacter]|uniref:SDR family NAD(P)-dependent oxidoreductase n=1 Tax=unclassified Arthrobacter TaxID=235627 RepID=UPI001D140A3A|nr:MULTISPECIES: SDR family oxidoreductase [unclassified Arthrobacter]MCC3290681.1 SDR family oxidoreductase [Arthrobacter sp. zg-Y1110]MCC3301931.1 SDR family oxidoreductase [Arthrobacter sp. zg-Y895]UWX86101.1 SDR family oxidoreductase [Arthrobacter sp. zg-Y1110]
MAAEIPSRKVIIHGAGGAIGGAVAEEFARRGAELFLAGHRLDSVNATADRIRALGGGPVHAAQVDASDPAAVDAHADAVVDAAGRIDAVLNAAGLPAVQGVPLLDMSVDDVVAPAAGWLRTQFITSRSAAVHMVSRGSGTVLMLSASPARVSIAGVGGFAAACAAVEALTRTLAAELGSSGVRVVCLRPQRILETIGSIPDLPMAPHEFTRFLESLTTTGTLPTLGEVAKAAVFLAEGGAGSMNGAVLNLTCGMSVD